jgi:hypothetical protein
MSAQRSAMAGYLRKVALCGVVLLVGVAASGFLWTWLSTKTGVFVFRLAAGPADGAPDLQAGVDVLQRRLEGLREQLRLGRSRAEALPPDRVELTLRYRDDYRVPLAWLTMPGRVEFRLVHPDEDVLAGEGAVPPEGYEPAVYRERRYILNRLGELKTVEHTFAVRIEPALGVERFAHAELATVGKKKAVVLTFTFEPEDARRFAEFTALHTGRRMAMLVDGEMFFPPKEIEGPVTSGRVQVQGYFLAAPLRRLVAVLNAGPLPAGLELVDSPAG